MTDKGDNRLAKYKKINIGDKFYRWTVIGIASPSNSGLKRWECECKCRNKSIVLDSGLKRGHSKSCGCLHKEVLSNRFTIHGYSRTEEYKSEFRTWTSIKSRCYSKGHNSYYLYGGRGIEMCESWKDSFLNFLKDMGEKPSKQHSIERIKNDGNYEPNNCKWATPKEQSRNKRNNHWIEYRGIKMVLHDWAEKLKLHEAVLGKLLKTKSFDEIYKKYIGE